MSEIDHRQLGVDLYNATWDLLDKPGRTVEDDDEMLAVAHASMYHWSRYGGVRPENVGRGHWLVARVHATLGQPDASAYHAARYLAIARTGQVADWDLAAALEASARAASVAGDFATAERLAAEAREACAQIADAEDRQVIEADLATLRRRP